MDTLAEVKGIISELFVIALSEITPESRLDDLGLDSLDIAELIQTIEKELEIEIPPSDPEKWATVEDVVKTMENL